MIRNCNVKTRFLCRRCLTSPEHLSHCEHVLFLDDLENPNIVFYENWPKDKLLDTIKEVFEIEKKVNDA